MDTALLLGLGMSALFGFARWRFPTVPKVLATAGMAVGIGLVIWSAMPNVRVGPALVGVSGLVLLVVATEWQLSLSATKPGPAPSEVPAQPVEEKPALVDGAEAVRREASSSDVPAVSAPSAMPTETAPAIPEGDRGAERAATLRQLTQLYILSNDGISSRMIAGMELPPADFLNEELERQGAEWRVRSVDGPNAETYDLP